MANLALHDRQRQLVQVHVVHDVAVPERVDRQLVERAPTPVTTVLAVDRSRGSHSSSDEREQTEYASSSVNLALLARYEVHSLVRFSGCGKALLCEVVECSIESPPGGGERVAGGD